MSTSQPCHAVAVFGGACAGSVTAETLAAAGCQVVVFEQNPRPYGKIEDGLPRWHDKQRRQEYDKIDARLGRPGVTYVPCTKLGRDLDFLDVARGWGFSAVVLATGAWRDRPLDAVGAAEAHDHGLVYQNPFIYWFNHKCEAAYDGPRYEVGARTIVVGGGLASIDCIKVVQLDLYERALRARGIGDVDIIEMEHKGIPRYLETLGITDPASLAVDPGLLVYRRRIEDMPLASAAADAPEKVIARLGATREKILGKAEEKFLFQTVPQRLPRRVVMEGGRVTGLEVQRTEVDGRRAVPVAGSEEILPADLIVSSIGSIPEPLPGVEMDGVYYRFSGGDEGVYGPLPGVFGAGNVVTGQGNIKVSLDHGKQVAAMLLERYLGTADDASRDLGTAYDAVAARSADAAQQVATHLQRVPPLPAARVTELLARARARQREVGYDGDYAAWIKKVTPADMQ